jgi:hypothetical protein
VRKKSSVRLAGNNDRIRLSPSVTKSLNDGSSHRSQRGPRNRRSIDGPKRERKSIPSDVLVGDGALDFPQCWINVLRRENLGE